MWRPPLSPTEIAPLIVSAVSNACQHWSTPASRWTGSGTLQLVRRIYPVRHRCRRGPYPRVWFYNDVFPGDTSGSHAANARWMQATVPARTVPAPWAASILMSRQPPHDHGRFAFVRQSAEDPASLAEEAAGNDEETGDYYGIPTEHRYYLDESGKTVYY